MRKIGIVGLGLNNPYFYAPLLKELGAQVAYVWDYTDENARAYAQQFGCEIIKRVEDYPQVDGVLIDSRNSDHIALAKPFIERDISVFIEKPLSHSVEQARNFLANCKGRKVFSLSPLRLAPTYIKMLEDIRTANEEIVHCHVTVYHTMKYFLENPIKRWHDDPSQSGGILTDIGIHAIELLNMFMHGKVASIQAISTKCHYHNARCDDNYAITVTYENGAIGTISLLCATDRTDYAVEAAMPTHTYINNMDHEYTGRPELNVDNAYGGFKGTMEAFLQMIETGLPPVSFTETERNFKMLDGMMAALIRR